VGAVKRGLLMGELGVLVFRINNPT